MIDITYPAVVNIAYRSRIAVNRTSVSNPPKKKKDDRCTRKRNKYNV